MPAPEAANRRGRQVYASELGCALNSDLHHGGGTDDTAILNAFLARASPANPIRLIIDGVALISGLILAPAGYTTIEGLGPTTGFFFAPGSKVSAIYNAYPPTTGPEKPPPRTANQLVFRDFSLNVNGGGNRNPVNYGISVINCQGVLLDRLTVTNPTQFCTRFDNCADILVTSCRFRSDNNFADGVHVCGPAERITVRDCWFATGDDAVALNCPEGYAGDITDVLVSDCFFENAWAVARVYTSTRSQQNAWYAKRVVFSRCLGSLRFMGFNFGIEASASRSEANQLQDILVTDCDLTSHLHFAKIDHPFGSISFVNCTHRAPQTDSPMISAGWAGADLLLSNCIILRSEQGHAPAYFLDCASVSGPVSRITLDGLRLVDEQFGSYASPPFMTNIFGAVSELRIRDVNMAGFASFTNTAGIAGLGHIGRITGAGVLGTATKIPDALVGNGTIYLSAATGKVSVKINDGAYPLY